MSISIPTRRRPRSVPFAPIRILEVELEDGIAGIGPVAPGRAPDGRPYGRAWVLGRIHGSPLGFIDIPIVEGGVPAVMLDATVRRELGEAIVRHLEADGWPAPGSRPCRDRRAAELRDGPWVSVIVPTVDRPEALRRCLDGLSRQTYRRFEVVVVDNDPSSSGASGVVAEAGAWFQDLRRIEEPLRGASRARNRGIAEARHAIVAFIDGDVRPDAGWLEGALSALLTPVPGAEGEAALPTCVTGPILPLVLDAQAQLWLEEWGGYAKGFERRAFDLDGHRADGPLFPYAIAGCGSGASMTMRRRDVIGLGGFDEALGGGTTAGSGEDLALLLDVVATGGTIAYEPDAIVWHEHPGTKAEIRRTLAAYGRGLTAYLTRHVVRHPGEIVRIGAALPAALAYFFQPGGGRNRRRTVGFPAWTWPIELGSMLAGPLAYAIGRHRQRGRRRQAGRDRPSRRAVG